MHHLQKFIECFQNCTKTPKIRRYHRMGQLSRSKLILILAFLIPSSLALSTRSRKTEQGLGELYASRPDETLTRATRRQILSFAASVTTFGVFPGLVSAFPNKISDKYDDRPKRKGPQVGGFFFESSKTINLTAPPTSPSLTSRSPRI